MARPGITYKDVVHAIQALATSKQNPTIESIRHQLGTGSSSTIAKYLRAWRTQTQQPAPHFESSTSSAEEAVVLMQNMWLTLNQHMQEKVKLLEEQHQLKIIDLEQTVHKYKHNNQRWQQLLEKWLDEKNKLTTEQKTAKMVIEQLRRQCDQAQFAIAALEEKLLFKEETIQDLKNELATIQAYSIQEKQQTSIERAQEIEQYQKLIVAFKKIVKTLFEKKRDDINAIQIKHIYDKPAQSDGYRILVERTWPKGLKKEKSKINQWLKEIAPSKTLHQWFLNNPRKWGQFCKQYQTELHNKEALLQDIKNILKKNAVTLLTSANDEKHHALILKRILLSD